MKSRARAPRGSTLLTSLAVTLLLALSGGTVEVAELLIERGAEVNVRTRNGHTPLSLAQRSGNRYLAELLIAKGAGE